MPASRLSFAWLESCTGSPRWLKFVLRRRSDEGGGGGVVVVASGVYFFIFSIFPLFSVECIKMHVL